MYTLTAQIEEKPKTTKQFEVPRVTKMEQFDPALVIPAEERLRKKKERYATISKQKKQIDTLQISEHKRKKLLKLIYTQPHSNRLAELSKLSEEEGIE